MITPLPEARSMSILLHDEGPPRKLELFWPWVASVSFHACVGIFIILVLIFWSRHGAGADRPAIIIPNSFDDPAYSEHPGGASNPGVGDPMREAAQGLKQLAQSEGWAASKGQDVSAMLGAS